MIWLLSILFASLPLYLIRFSIGPLPTTVLEIWIGITVLSWIGIKIKERTWPHVPNKKLLVTLGLFLTGSVVGVLVSPNLRAALGEWKAFYFEPLIIAWIVIDTVKRKADVNKIFGGLLLGALSTALLAVYQHFTGWLVPDSFWANRNTYRVTGWYGFPNSVGILLAPLIPIAIYFGKEFYQKQNHTKSTWGVLSLLVVFLISAPLAILFAKTTAAIVGLTAGLGVFLLCFKKTRWPAILLGIIGLISLFILPNNPVTNEILARDYSGQLRRDIWSETVTYLKLHPITGTGIAGYTSEITPFRHNKKIEVFHHPHNIFLTMWVNIGAIGLLGFIGILAWFYLTLIKNLFSDNRVLSITLLTTMTIWLTIGLVDSPYIKNDWALIFWLVISLSSLLPKFNKA